MAMTSRGLRTGMSPTSRDLEGLRTDELGLQLGLAVFQQHGDDLFQILAELFDAGPLRMRSRPAWDVADVESRLRVLLDHGGEVPHVFRLASRLGGVEPTHVAGAGAHSRC